MQLYYFYLFELSFVCMCNFLSIAQVNLRQNVWPSVLSILKTVFLISEVLLG